MWMLMGSMFMPSLQGAGNDGMLWRHLLSTREMILALLLLAASSPCCHHLAGAFVVAPPAVAMKNMRIRRRMGADGSRWKLRVAVVASHSFSARRLEAIRSGASLVSTSSTSQSTSPSVESSSKESSTGDHLTTLHDEPILRTLYDPPPPIENISASIHNIDDSAHNNTDNEIDQGNDKWATRITHGTLPTEEGSPHVLHYEVHHRFQQRQQTSEQTQQSKQGTKGLTALFLHGGPGAACFPNHVRFFSPELYETVVLLDQRGCGRSTPRGRVEENTLELLVEDVERLRVHLLERSEVDDNDNEVGGREDATISSSSAAAAASGATRPWDVILGGSWGCTLALAYAHAYPNRVRAMVLRGICLFRPLEIDWLFGDPAPSSSLLPTKTSNLRSLLSGVGGGNGSGGDGGASSSDTTTAAAVSRTTATASSIFPREWDKFCKGSIIGNFKDDVDVPSTDFASTREQTQRNGIKNRRSILYRYYHLLLGSDPIIRLNATRSWMQWEMGIYASGFRGTNSGGNNKSNSSNTDDKYGVLVWNPHAKYWAYEDARVSNNQSFVPISRLSPPSSISPLQGSSRILVKDDRKELPQSLRRFPSSSIPMTRTPSSPSPPVPIPLRSTATSASIALKESSSTASITTNTSSRNSTTDATSAHNIIPAQAMLTCYFSTNDEYCIGRYRSFLSLEPPPLSMPMSSWYSSRLPPLVTQLSPQPESSSAPPQPKAATSAITSFPLPPTIAIQGANDAICPPGTALDLHEVWNEMELRIVMNGGHSMYDPVVAGEIVKALDRFGHELKNELN